MTQKHIVELLVEANKNISDTIDKLENNSSENKEIIIRQVNDVIRQLDEIVEHLEK